MMCHLQPIVYGRSIDLAKLLVDATRLEEKLKLLQGMFLWLQVMYVSIIFNCICKKWYKNKTNSYYLHVVFKLWMQHSCAKDDTNRRFQEHNLHIVKICMENNCTRLCTRYPTFQITFLYKKNFWLKNFRFHCVM